MIATKTMELIQSYLKEHSNIPNIIPFARLMLSLNIPEAEEITGKLMMKKAYVKQVKSLLMKLVVRVL